MGSKPMNLLFIFSDQHSKEKIGCYGNPVVKTPNLDRLAENGVRFSNAYTNCPICVPARSSLATGRYPHQIRSWDNASPYCGEVPSWGHRLEGQGHHVTTIGKLHYRNDKDNTGFSDQRLPLHVKNEIGDIYGTLREDRCIKPQLCDSILEARVGESSYIAYDMAVAEEAQKFLKEAGNQHEKPWALFVGLVTPHFPFIVPQKYMDMYPLESVIFPKQYSLEERPKHPSLDYLRRYMGIEGELEEKDIRKAIAAYYGLCTFMDEQVGKVLQALKEAGLDENTRIVYASDHGDMTGDHGLWFKSSLYEGSAGVPFIMSGPDLSKGKVIDTPISLIDCFPTIVESVGAELALEDKDLPGMSLLPIAKGDIDPERIAYCEYHASASKNGGFMLRKGDYKYIYYVGYPPQLFNLKKDPDELLDLAGDSAYEQILKECNKALYSIVDPEQIDLMAKEDQEKRLDSHGGRENVYKSRNFVVYSPPPSLK